MTWCPSSKFLLTEWGQDHGEHSGEFPQIFFVPRNSFVKTYSSNKNIAPLKIILPPNLKIWLRAWVGPRKSASNRAPHLLRPALTLPYTAAVTSHMDQEKMQTTYSIVIYKTEATEVRAFTV